jgi:HlyD family secretion protein
VVRAPQSAVFRDGDAYAVFAVEDGVARRTPVEVGLQNGMEAEIRAGLAPGARVVVFPGDRVGDGVEVVER